MSVKESNAKIRNARIKRDRAEIAYISLITAHVNQFGAPETVVKKAKAAAAAPATPAKKPKPKNNDPFICAGNLILGTPCVTKKAERAPDTIHNKKKHATCTECKKAMKKTKKAVAAAAEAME